MAHIRTKAELDALTLTPAEKKLIDACQKGEFCVLGNGELPAKGMPDPQRHIHANVLRYLILGGCENCRTDEAGVYVRGAHITGILDLDFTTIRGALQMPDSRFEERFHCEQTKCQQLNLIGSDLQGIRGQGLQVFGDLFLREITAHETIRLNSAVIGDQLDFSHATFNVQIGIAIFADSAVTDGSVILNGIHTYAPCIFKNAHIKGNFVVNHACFDIAHGTALDANSMRIDKDLIWKNNEVKSSEILFTEVKCDRLIDDPEKGPDNSRFDLNGMLYNKIVGATIDVKTRLSWLEKGAVKQGVFHSQPYTQLAEVLSNMGFKKNARKILYRHDVLKRRHDRTSRNQEPLKLQRPNYVEACARDIIYLLKWFFSDAPYRFFAGYGHYPFRSLWALLIVFFIAIFPAHFAWDEGSMTPNSAIILNSEDWQSYLPKEKPSHLWATQSEIGQDWETFNRYAFAADMVIPVLDFGQTDAWSPSTSRGPWGWHLWWLQWFFGVIGWIATVVGPIIISQQIRRD